ncbi:MAG: PEGA domain-containing protein [bacterium]
MNSNSRFIIFILTLIIIAFLSWVVIFFAQGYRLSGLEFFGQRKAPLIEKTGMLMVKSWPDGARLFVDDVLEGPTNTSVGNLTPGTHKVKVLKEGRFEYTKTVTIYEELVTVVEALLVPLSPTLSPVTYNGVANTSKAPSGNSLVYSSSGNGEPGGIWKLDFNSGSGVALLASDKTGIPFSKVTEFSWSPNETEILAKVNSQYYLLSFNIANISPVPVEAELVLSAWKKTAQEKKSVKAERQKLPVEMQKIATTASTLWAPDEKRFMYEALDPALDTMQYRVFSLLDPRPVGEEEDYIAFEKDQSDTEVKSIFWYGDGRHLVIVEEGSIYLREIDGENKALIFSGDFDTNRVYAKPGGGGVIILTGFNEQAPQNFYLIGI